MTPYLLQPTVALVVGFCKSLSGKSLSVISAAMHLLVLGLLLGFPSFAHFPEFCYEEVDVHRQAKLPQLPGKLFAQGRAVVEEGRREGSWCRQHHAALTTGLHGINASFLPLFSPLPPQAEAWWL